LKLDFIGEAAAEAGDLDPLSHADERDLERVDPGGVVDEDGDRAGTVVDRKLDAETWVIEDVADHTGDGDDAALGGVAHLARGDPQRRGRQELDAGGFGADEKDIERLIEGPRHAHLLVAMNAEVDVEADVDAAGDVLHGEAARVLEARRREESGGNGDAALNGDRGAERQLADGGDRLGRGGNG